MNLNDVYLATHAGCLDGSVCAILFLIAGGKKENLYFSGANHNSTKDLMEDLLDRNKSIMFVDLSIPLKQAEKLDNTNQDVLIFDHHASAIPINRFDWCNIDVNNKRCGAKIFYDWLLTNGFHHGHNNNIVNYKTLVDIADDRDRWVNQHMDTPSIVSLHEVLSQEFFIERFVGNHNIDLTAQEQYVIELENKKRESYIQNKLKKAFFYTKKINGENIKCAVTTAKGYQSEIGSALCANPIDGADVAIIISNDHISFRSRKDDFFLDLSQVAKLNGGGGHKAAAGCTISNLLGQDFIEFVFDKIKFF